MIFFKKKTQDPSPKPEKALKKPVAPALPEPKPVKSLQEIAHTRVLTAEGWRRSVEKKISKK